MDKQLKRAKQILQAESDAVRNIPLDGSLLKAVDMIVNCKGKVVTSGIGKAGLIARKVSSTFSSTGTPSVYLHPGEAQHGDLGMLGKDDLLLVFSNSGKTREVIEMVTLAHRLNGVKMPVITITSHPDSELAKSSEVVLNIGNIKEVCSLGMAPTTSTTAMVALGDVLCVLVMEEIQFTMEEFAKRHHGGYLGIRLHEKKPGEIGY
ncbi:MAG TPA: SIS domain-containing protein [Chitinophagales bacterium]|nr:SIS domain-containing protein [Chitinophagales bacterium]